ncbi:MAG: DUF4832 domain-containing protein [Bryobacteraceae bacterium]|nr:DUF4832 domain-containing protein [Bryobacteraceae bacterium]
MISAQFRFSSAFLLAASLWAQSEAVVVRPVEIDDVLVNPGMGIQTFQRYNGDPINPGLRWSEEGPDKRIKAASAKPDYPDSSIAYFRWFWNQIEPEQGKYRWDILDLALEEARKHNQKLAIRLMPYDEGHPLPEWYRKSGARRANTDDDKEWKTWAPDADDPLYLKHWGGLILAAGARYDGHPFLDSVDISTVGYWGEGWGPYLPSWERQKELIDVNFEAFQRTPLLVNFDEPRALAYATQKGSGWRLDCWGDMGNYWESWGRHLSHMLDVYPQQVVRAGASRVWERSPVSLETCWVPGYWHQKNWDLDYIFEQALRWHVTSVNIKSSAIPPDWKQKFREFEKRMGYRFVLRRLEYPQVVKAGEMMPVKSWWVNKGVAPPYGDFVLAFGIGDSVIKTSANLRTWLPDDQVFDASLFLPPELKRGEHKIRVAVLDGRTGAPAVKLAIQGLQSDGWYDLGTIRIQ